MALYDGPSECSGDIHINVKCARRGECRIETFQQFQIALAAGPQIDLLPTRQLHGAIGGEISPLSHQPEGLELKYPVGRSKFDGTLIVQSHIFDVHREIGKRTGYTQFTRLTKRP